MESVNEKDEVRLDDEGVNSEQTVILLALIEGDVVESGALAVEVKEVFQMLDVALEAVEGAVTVLGAAWILFCL